MKKPHHNIFVFSDLDDTLLQSKKKYAPDICDIHEKTAELQQSSSYISQQQGMLLNLFAQAGATVIPVTGRDTNAFSRVKLSLFNSFHILSHGAIVTTPDNRLCPVWFDNLTTHYDLPLWHNLLQKLNEKTISFIEKNHLPAQSNVLEDLGISAYLSIKSIGTTCEPHAPDPCLNRLTEFFESEIPDSMEIHSNGNNMAIKPPYCSKHKAMTFVSDQLNISACDLVIGAGDSVSDLPFMRQCYFNIFPSGSQIDKQLMIHEKPF